MKRQSRAMRLGVLALTLTMITTCLTGGTLARYVTEVTGTATAAVAKWSFKADSKDNVGETFAEIDLGDTTHRTAYKAGDIADDVIAPGTSGSFDIVIDGSDSEVGIDYTVVIAAGKDGSYQTITLPNDLTFEIDNASYSLGSEKTGTIDYSNTAADMKKKITVKWDWAFDENDTTSANDNEYAGKAWTLDIAVTGKQVTPETSAP